MPGKCCCRTKDSCTAIPLNRLNRQSNYAMSWIRSNINSIITFVSWLDSPSGPGPPHYRGFTITLRHTTRGRTHLDEWSTPLADLSFTTHNNHMRQISIIPVRFEPAISASKWQQIQRLNPLSEWDRQKYEHSYKNTVNKPARNSVVFT
jgi:hypothetical protein